MRWVFDSARGLGWPEDRLHRAYFAVEPTVAANGCAVGVQKESVTAQPI
jgi:hypothetical protein